MKSKFSSSWLSSVQVRKQRKFRYNAPLHIRHKFLSTSLSKELRKKYGKRSIAVKKGDEVLIMRGSFKKKKGKILEIDLKRSRVSIENINRTKKDGTKVNVYLNASSLQIQNLNLEDNRRFKRINREEKTETKREEKTVEKKETVEEKNAPDKNTS
jgi:large subunit ribosomal protein L24